MRNRQVKETQQEELAKRIQYDGHKLEYSNSIIENRIASRILVDTVQNASSALSFFDNNSRSTTGTTEGFLLLEEKSVSLLSQSKKWIRLVSSSLKSNSSNSDDTRLTLLLSNLHVTSHVLRAVCPILLHGTHNFKEALIQLLYHTIINSEDLYLLANDNNMKADAANICLSSLHALAYILSAGSELSNVKIVNNAFPAPSVDFQGGNGCYKDGVKTSETGLNLNQICKMIIGSLLSSFSILSTLNNVLHHCKRSVLTDSEFGDHFLFFVKAFMPSQTSYFPHLNLIVTATISWIQLLFLIEKNGETSAKYIQRAYWLVWDAASRIEKSLLANEKDKLQETPNILKAKASLEIKSDAILALLLMCTNSSPDLISKLWSSHNTTTDHLKTQLRLACTSAWKAAASYSQFSLRIIKDEASLIDRNMALKAFHDKIGYFIDKTVHFLLSERMGKTSTPEEIKEYVEYCAWRAIHLSSFTETECRHCQKAIISTSETSSKKETINNLNLNESSLKQVYCRCNCKGSSCVYLHVPYLFEHQFQKVGHNLYENVLTIFFLGLQTQEHYKKMKANPATRTYRCDHIVESLSEEYHKFSSFLKYGLRKDPRRYNHEDFYRCWKILALLKPITFANEVVKDINANAFDISEHINVLMSHFSLFLSHCYAPLSEIVAHGLNNKSSTIEISSRNEGVITDKRKYQAHEAAIDSYQNAIHLVCYINYQSNQKLDSCQIEQYLISFHNLSLAGLQVKQIEINAKVLAITVKRFVELNDYSSATIALLLSTNLYSFVSTSNKFYQLQYCYSYLASIFHSICLWKESIIANTLALKYCSRIDRSDEERTQTTNKILLSAGKICEFKLSTQIERLIGQITHARTKQPGDKENTLINSPTYKNVLDSSIFGQTLREHNNRVDEIPKSSCLTNHISFADILDIIIVEDPDTSQLEKVEILRECLRYLGYRLADKSNIFNVLGDNNIATYEVTDGDFKLVLDMALSFTKHIDVEKNEASMYLVAASSLASQIMGKSYIASKTVDTDIDSPKTTSQILHKIAYNYACRTASILHNSKYHDVFPLITLASIGIFVTELSDGILWKSNDIKMHHLEYNMSNADLLLLCKSAVEIAKKSPSNATDKKNDEYLFLQLCLASILTSLFSRFFYDGSTILASQASSLVALVNHEYQNACWGYVATGEVLTESEFYSTASTLLSESKSFSGKQYNNYSSNSMNKVNYWNSCAVKGLLRVRSSHPYDLANVDDYFHKLMSKLEKDFPSIEDELLMIRNEINWTLCICHQALFEAKEKCGDIDKCLELLLKGSNICHNALKLCKRKKSKIGQSSIDLTPHVLARCWNVKLAQFFQFTASIYSKIGNWKKSISYAQAAVEILESNTETLSCKNHDVFLFKPIDTESNRQTASRRLLGEMKALSSTLEHGNFPDASEFIGPVCNLEEDTDYGNVDQMIEKIKGLLTLGDFLKHISRSNQNFLMHYEQAEHNLSLMHQERLQVEILKITRPLNQNKLLAPNLTATPDKTILGGIINEVKLRKAESLNGDAAESLYQEVRTSPYANGNLRAKACYNLGLIALGDARKSGALYDLWREHSILPATGNEDDIKQRNCFCREVKSKNSLDNAIQFLSEAKKISGPPTNLLSRLILRSLALALGPKKITSSILSSVLLVHRSIGGSARKELYRRMTYSGDEEVDRNVNTTSPLSENYDLGTVLKIFDNMDDDKDLDVFFQQAADVLPPEWNIVAKTLCPSGELLIASLKVLPDTLPRKLTSSIVCLFPEEADYTGSNSCYDQYSVVSCSFYRNVLQPFSEIMERNQKNLSNVASIAAVEKSNVKNNGAKDWWKERKAIDKQLHSLINNTEKRFFTRNCMERIILGQSEGNTTCNQAIEEVHSSDESSSLEVGNLSVKFEAACTTKEMSTEREFDKCDDILSKRRDKEEELKEMYQKWTVVQIKQELETCGVEKKQFRKLRKAELIQFLIQQQQFDDQSQWIDDDSTTCDSISEDHLMMQGFHNPSIDTSFSSPLHPDSATKNHPCTDQNPCLFLILDENLQEFPWEGMDFLSSLAISRLPSLSFAIATLVEEKQNMAQEDRDSDITAAMTPITSSSFPYINPEETSYVLDPDSNLTTTKETLIPVLESICTKGGWQDHWNGVVGEVPALDFLEHALKRNHGLFIYCGHGGGTLSKSQIDHLFNKPASSNTYCGSSIKNKEETHKRRPCKASVLLMGCSSGKLNSGGSCKKEGALDNSSSSIVDKIYEPEGVATTYLLTGSPCVVGNLWDVTDRDIDRYTNLLLESFFQSSTEEDGLKSSSLSPFSNKKSLARCVADARVACKMRYIVGCAPVCYGIPISCK